MINERRRKLVEKVKISNVVKKTGSMFLKYSIKVFPSKKRLALFDWDGTICDWFKYPKEKGIPLKLRQGLSEFSKKYIVAINTARNYSTLSREIKNTNFGLDIKNGLFKSKNKDILLQKILITDQDGKTFYEYGIPVISELGSRISMMIRDDKEHVKFIEIKAFHIAKKDIEAFINIVHDGGKFKKLIFYSKYKGEVVVYLDSEALEKDNSDYSGMNIFLIKNSEELEKILLEESISLIDVHGMNKKGLDLLKESNLNIIPLYRDKSSFHFSPNKYHEKTNEVEKINKGTATQELYKIFKGVNIRKRSRKIDKRKKMFFAPDFTAGDDPSIDDSLHNQPSKTAVIIGKSYENQVLKHKKEGGPEKTLNIKDPEQLGELLLKMSKPDYKKIFKGIEFTSLIGNMAKNLHLV